jgi:hypothetical protein
MLLELARVLLDALAFASARDASWLSIHARANAALAFMPAGRAVSEAIKVSGYAATFGVKRAAEMVARAHATRLLAIALASFAAAFACALLATRAVTLAAFGHGVVVLAFALVLRRAARRVPSRRGAFVLQLSTRALQIAQIAIAIAVVTTPTVGRALVGEAAALLGSALGEASPAQAGAFDGAFAIVREPLGLTASSAVAVALLLRLAQLAAALAGLGVMPLRRLWTALANRARRSSRIARSSAPARSMLDAR